MADDEVSHVVLGLVSGCHTVTETGNAERCNVLHVTKFLFPFFDGITVGIDHDNTSTQGSEHRAFEHPFVTCRHPQELRVRTCPDKGVLWTFHQYDRSGRIAWQKQE